MTTAAHFMAAVRGIPAHHVTKALNCFTWGVDWSKCSKRHMAEEYELAHVPNGRGRASLRTLDLNHLARMAKARQQGDPYWASTPKVYRHQLTINLIVNPEEEPTS